MMDASNSRARVARVAHASITSRKSCICKNLEGLNYRLSHRATVRTQACLARHGIRNYLPATNGCPNCRINPPAASMNRFIGPGSKSWSLGLNPKNPKHSGPPSAESWLAGKGLGAASSTVARCFYASKLWRLPRCFEFSVALEGSGAWRC